MDDPEYVKRAKEYQRQYYLKHREKRLAYSRANQERANLLRRQKNASIGRALNKTGIETDSKQEYNKRYHVERRAELLLREKYQALQVVSGLARPVCQSCGHSDHRVLCINHINGEGRKEHSICKPHDFRRNIISGVRRTDDLNVLCHNCNIRYEYERGRLRLPRNSEQVIEEEADNYARRNSISV